MKLLASQAPAKWVITFWHLASALFSRQMVVAKVVIANPVGEVRATREGEKWVREQRSTLGRKRVRTSRQVPHFHLEPLILWSKVQRAGGRREAASHKKDVNPWEGNDAEI